MATTPAALVSAILTLLAPIAFAQQRVEGVQSLADGKRQATPSDNDLRSAYCVAVLKGQIPWVRDHVVAKVDGAPTDASRPNFSGLTRRYARKHTYGWKGSWRRKPEWWRT